MNTIKMTAALSWLLSHAKNGKLPEHLTEDDRAVLVSYLSVGIDKLAEVEQPKNDESEDQVIEKLVVLTHDTIRGEYT